MISKIIHAETTSVEELSDGKQDDDTGLCNSGIKKQEIAAKLMLGRYLSGLVLLFTWEFLPMQTLLPSFEHDLMNIRTIVSVGFGVKIDLNKSNGIFISEERSHIIYSVKDFLRCWIH